MSDLVRIILSPPRGADGLFMQPHESGPDRETVEAHNRERFANHFNYADPFTGNTDTFDQAGNYNCGRCNQADGTNCLLIEEPSDVDLTAGSCRHWENINAGDAEMVLHRESRDVASYGVAANGQGFGCHRCPFASTAYEADSLGRTMYCGYGDFRIFPYACCELNGAPLNGDSVNKESIERFPGAVKAMFPVSERFISKDERDAADDSDFAGSGRSFPILKKADVKAAIHSIGRGVAGGQSAAALKSKIKAIAKRKGWASELPDDWKDGDGDKEASLWKPDGVLLVEGARFLDEPRLQEAATADYPIKLIAPGRGSSGYYTEGVLKQAAGAKVFKAGTQMFWNHDTDAEESARPEGDLNRLAAVTTTDATWDEAGRDGPGLYARAKVFSDYADKVREKGPHIGLSIRAGGSRDESAHGPDGKPRVITELRNAMSVDFVTKAGRDGKIFTESAGVAEPHTQETSSMDENQVKALIKEAVTPLETKLTEAQTENKALRARLSQAEAPARIRETLATIRMTDYGKAEVIRRLVERGLPDDPTELAKAVEAEARNVAELLRAAGVGDNVAAFGARMTEAEIEAQAKGSEKQHGKAWKESITGLCDLFVGPKLAEGEADPVIVAKRKAARKAFKEGRAA